MITLYTQTTPNGRKPMILLEEIGAQYNCHFVDFSAAEQKTPEFLALNPNGKIPVLVDEDAVGGARHVVFESGAILIYLAEKFGSPLWPTEPLLRSIVLQWLMFQMASVGPMIGQAGYFFRNSEPPQALALARFRDEALRVLRVLDTRLSQADYLGGDYSIADIATYPWVVLGSEFASLDLTPFVALRRWIEEIGARPAVIRAMAASA